MKVDSIKLIFLMFLINVLYGYRDNHDDPPLVDQDMQLFLCHIQELNYHLIVIL